MQLKNRTDDYDSFTKYTDNENDHIIMFVKYLHPSIRESVIILSMIGLILCTNLKPYY